MSLACSRITISLARIHPFIVLVELLMSQKYAPVATFCESRFIYIKMFVNPSRVIKWFLRIFSWPYQGQMSNTNNYCLEVLLTTYDITNATETIHITYIIVQMVIHKEIMKFRLKCLLGCHGNDDFNFKFYTFTVYNMRISWRKVAWQECR